MLTGYTTPGHLFFLPDSHMDVFILQDSIHQPLLINMSMLPAHAQRVVSKRADSAVEMCVFLSAGSSTFLPILHV